MGALASGFSCVCWVPWVSLEAPWVLGSLGSQVCAVATAWIFPGRQRVQLYVLGPLALPGGSLGSGFLGLSGVRRRLLSKVSDHFYKLLGGGYMYKGSLL